MNTDYSLVTQTPFTNAKVVAVGYDPEKYHKDNAKRGSKDYHIGRSSLLEFEACPHKWLNSGDSEDTASTEWGSAIDCLLLTPADFEKRYAICPATYTDDKGVEKPWTFAAKVCKAWRDEREGMHVLQSDVFDDVSKAAGIVQMDMELSTLLATSDCQVYVTGDYLDAVTGETAHVKTLIDILPNADSPWKRSVMDLKSARDASPDKWVRAVFEYGYDVQAAMSLDLYMAACPEEDRNDFRHVIVENVAPFEIGKRIVGEEFLNRGRFIYENALKHYCECLHTGVWHGYDAQTKHQMGGWTFTSPENWMVNAKNL